MIADQPSIWDTVRAAPPRPGERSIAQRYVDWRATPIGQHVYREAVALALEARRRGIAHYGIKAICEVVRWQRTIAEPGHDAEGFKVNNNYTALLAREIMAAHPQLDGFFEIRQRLVE